MPKGYEFMLQLGKEEDIFISFLDEEKIVKAICPRKHWGKKDALQHLQDHLNKNATTDNHKLFEDPVFITIEFLKEDYYGDNALDAVMSMMGFSGKRYKVTRNALRKSVNKNLDVIKKEIK